MVLMLPLLYRGLGGLLAITLISILVNLFFRSGFYREARDSGENRGVGVRVSRNKGGGAPLVLDQDPRALAYALVV